MILARYDENGVPSFYDTAISYPGGIPTPTIQITDEQHTDFFARGQRHRVINGEFVYVEPPAPTLEEERAKAWEMIKAERDRREQVGVPYMGKILDSDPVSVQRISIAVQAAQAAIAAGQDFTLGWTCADNTVLNMTAFQVVGMPVALAQYSNQLHQTARELRAQIESATTKEELVAIVWPE